jgi:hypothetical protein
MYPSLTNLATWLIRIGVLTLMTFFILLLSQNYFKSARFVAIFGSA